MAVTYSQLRKTATAYSRLRKFNPNHDSKGRFSSSGGASSFTYRPGASVAHDKAIYREKIKQEGTFGNSDTKQFADAVDSAKGNLAKIKPEDAWRVTAHTQAELEEYYPGAKLHVTKGGSTMAVTNDGDIISVCKNPGDNIRGKELIQFSVDNGGKKLDSYSGNHKFYIKCGFEPVSWCGWDEQYKPPDWNGDVDSRYKREPIIFYKHTGKQSAYKSEADFMNSVKSESDYDTAQKIRDNNL